MLATPPFVSTVNDVRRVRFVACRKRAKIRSPLPDFSASLPSGLKMRRPKSARRAGTSTSTPSAPTPVWRSHSRAHARGRDREVELRRIDHEVVVAEPVALEERVAHGARMLAERASRAAWDMLSRMPELPDVTVYVERLAARCVGQTLERVRVVGPVAAAQRRSAALRGRGPRACSACAGSASASCSSSEDELFLVFHLMIAGRFHWRERGARPSRQDSVSPRSTSRPARSSSPRRARRSARRCTSCAARRRSPSTIRAGSRCSSATPDAVSRAPALREPHAQARAHRSAHLLRHRQRLLRRDPAPRAALAGHAHAAALGRGASRASTRRRARRSSEWIERLRDEVGEGFPEKVTAFRPEMAVHGRYREPCPVCGAPVQRIVYAANETNYCARCQTGGKLLADRALSRLLKKDWPKSLDELEARRSGTSRCRSSRASSRSTSTARCSIRTGSSPPR